MIEIIGSNKFNVVNKYNDIQIIQDKMLFLGQGIMIYLENLECFWHAGSL